MRTGWKTIAPIVPARRYVVLLSYLPLKHRRRLPWMMVYSWRITRQLRTARGLAGYSLLAHPLKKSFWTLSAWDNDTALQTFVRTAPHREIMGALAPHMGKTSFTQWAAPGGDLPPRWEEALRRQGRTAG
jgi:hypothetical protein